MTPRQEEIETSALLYAIEKYPVKIQTIGGGGHYAEVDVNEEKCKDCYEHFMAGVNYIISQIN